MTKEDIKNKCLAMQQTLLDKYFGNIIHEAAVEQPETIGEYTQELPLEIEAEYYEFLKKLWPEVAPDDSRSLDEILGKRHLRDLMTAGNREETNHAYDNAQRRTLWERITKSNHEDVILYKALLKDYTDGLLTCMRVDFVEDIERLQQMPKEKIMKTDNTYIPQPIDTNDVELPEELVQLSEMIAENVHEVWARDRMNQGWTYGEHRDDKLKQTPCLIPYNELPEEEKEYDRNTSQETLKVILKLGFKISKG